MKPIAVTAKKPDLGEKVLIYRQWENYEGKLCGEWYHAFYRVHPSDKRRRVFANWPEDITDSPWVYEDVTHWMPMPDAPKG